MLTGRTRIYATLAHPCHHVKTPETMNALFQARDHDAMMIACDIPPEGLAAAFDGFRAQRNFGGMVVSVPHKTAAVALCDELSTRAEAAQAINAVRRTADGRLIGDILDGAGFVAGLKNAGHTLSGRNIWLLGAGGAASAIALALAAEAPAALTLWNRTAAKAETLAGRVHAHHPKLTTRVDPSFAGHDLVINATSLGLRVEDPLPFDTNRLTGRELVADVIIEPALTPLLRAAEAQGCTVHTGRAMLAGQLEAIYAYLTHDIRASTEA